MPISEDTIALLLKIQRRRHPQKGDSRTSFIMPEMYGNLKYLSNNVLTSPFSAQSYGFVTDSKRVIAAAK
jgi:hypothetical protein